ncbi:MAG: O-antigen ligase family protein [Paludibacter sp.]|nr:O-antigen ligase family protein [Paludibacter sp.]
MLFLFILMFIQVTPLSFQFNSWKNNFIYFILSTVVIVNMCVYEKDGRNLIKLAIIFSLTISIIYGFILIPLQGINPYIDLLSDSYNLTNMSEAYSSNDRLLELGIFGRIQSTFIHPTSWSFYLVIMFTTVFIFFEVEKKYLYLIILIMIFISVLIANVRTGLFTVLFSLFYYFVKTKKNKNRLYIGVALLLLIFILISNDNTSSYVKSVADVNGTQTDVGGSTINDRYMQLLGTFDEIKDNLFLGKGYDWVGYYNYSNKGKTHPKIMGFESIIYVILCNWGVLGLILWIVFFISLFRLNRRFVRNREYVVLIDLYLLSYIIFTLITGDYNFLKLWVLYYSYLLVYLHFENKKNIKFKINKQSNGK